MSYYGSLETCSHGHENVAFVGHRCPVCDALSDLKMIEEKVVELKSDAQKISHYIITLEAKLESYEEDFKKWKEIVDKLEGNTYQEE